MLAQVSDVIARVDAAILRPLIALLFAAALIYFLWGAYVFVKNAEAPEERKVGQRHMIYGVAGMVIMAMVHPIINILLTTFGITLP